MKIFLTGATGFIGSHFVNQAIMNGHTVIGLRRSPLSRPKVGLIEEPQWLDKPMDQVMASDIEGSDIVVHLAAHTGNVPYDSLLNYLHWNLNVVLRLFEEARMAGVKQYLVAGSCFEYGLSGERYQFIPVDAPLEPTNSYAVSKAAASIALQQWAREHKQKLMILRVFHVYGEGEAASRLWPTLQQAAWSGADFPMTLGEQVRDFIDVVDVARRFINEAEFLISALPSVSVINLGSGQPKTIRDFSEYWWSKWQGKGKLLLGAIAYREGEVLRYVPKV